MEIDDLKSEIESLKNELAKVNHLYDQSQEQLVNLINFGELAIFECDKDYKIISSYGAVDPIFRNLNQLYGKYKNLVDLLNHCINLIEEEDIEKDDENEPFIKVDISNSLLSFKNSTSKNINLDLFGKLASEEIYDLNVKLTKSEFKITAYVRFIPSSFFLKRFEQKVKSDLESKDLLLSNIFEAIEYGATLLDLRGRILLMNQKAKDHHISDEAKILKNAQLHGRLYRDLFTNETNEEYSERLRVHDKAKSNQAPVKYSKKTNGKLVHFEIVPLFDHNKLPIGLFISTKIDSPKDVNIEVKINKITQLAKHLKSENDNLVERVKELELNQQWLMKKNDESQNNTKLLHESLRQIYFYLELMPFPMSILEIPSGKYQFINNSFLKLVKLEKNAVLSKIDDQIFPDNISDLLTAKTAETINTQQMITFPFLDTICKQYLIKHNDSSYILRIYEQGYNGQL